MEALWDESQIKSHVLEKSVTDKALRNNSLGED